jgi:hypothetical protein
MRLHFSSTIGILSVEVHELDTMQSVKEKIQMIEPPFTVARQQFSLRNQVLADDKKCASSAECSQTVGE